MLPLSKLDGAPTPVDDVAAGVLKKASLAVALVAIVAILGLLRFRRWVESALRSAAEQLKAFFGARRSDLISWFAANRSEVVGLGLIISSGIILRWALIESPIRFDETHTFLRWARRSWLDVISDYRQPNNHIFHTMWVHLSYKLFGSGPAAIRAPA